MDRWLSAICKNAKHTQEKLQYLEEREQKLLKTVRRNEFIMEDDQKSNKLRADVHKKLMLEAMEIEAARTWPNLTNLDQRVNHDVILP